jgi:hypothetical protein
VKKIAESSDPLLESLTTENPGELSHQCQLDPTRQQELQVQIPPKFKFHQFYLDLQNRLKGQMPRSSLSGEYPKQWDFAHHREK